MELNMYLNDKFKEGFKTEQFVSSTDIVRNFSKLRLKAKEAPLLILDKNNPDSVLLSIEDYNEVIKIMHDLSEEIFDLKVMNQLKRMEAEGYKTVPFSEVKSEYIQETMSEIENWDISDEELFE